MMDENSQPSAGQPLSAEPLPAAPAKKSFPTLGDLFAMLGIALGMQIVAGLVLTVALAVMGKLSEVWTPEQQGAITAATYLLSMLPAYLLVLLYCRMRGGRVCIGRFSMRGLNPVLLAWGFLFMMAAGVVCEPLFSVLPAPPDFHFGRGLWAVLTLIVAAPVLEELLCRGAVLGMLRTRFGVVASWLLSSLFFGVLHVHPMLVVNAFVIGLILGYIYLVSESLWASMALHALNNTVAYFMMIGGRGDILLMDMIENRRLYVVVYIGAVVVTALSAWMVWRKLRRLKEAAENPVLE